MTAPLGDAPLLAAEDLAFGYPGHAVGWGVSVQVRAGELLCLLGPNGSGKTTLFKTLLGLLPRQGGRLFLGGEDPARLTRTEVARRIAYVPQSHQAFFPFTVGEVVLMGRTAHLGPLSSPGPQDWAAAAGALEDLGLGPLATRAYTDVSGGERQLTLIARALAQGAPVLVMDEPTASLDFGNQVRVLSRIRALKAAGRGIVLSTHDPAQAFALADRVALLREGQVIAQGPPTQVATAEALSDLYGVAVAVAPLPALGATAVVPRVGQVM